MPLQVCFVCSPLSCLLLTLWKVVEESSLCLQHLRQLPCILVQSCMGDSGLVQVFVLDRVLEEDGVTGDAYGPYDADFVAEERARVSREKVLFIWQQPSFAVPLLQAPSLLRLLSGLSTFVV